ncbi:hypothetical protein [Sphingomonas sp. NFR15]|uniref:hypothetical protein n=1 Tax=Sphingomonas sp. NFR15 TaxID=1566282 RepID=UPI00115F99E9|nr:hypothetical protein [Sphingomonas sp. NFR15]
MMPIASAITTLFRNVDKGALPPRREQILLHVSRIGVEVRAQQLGQCIFEMCHADDRKGAIAGLHTLSQIYHQLHFIPVVDRHLSLLHLSRALHPR